MKILAYTALALALATTAASAQAPQRKGGAAAQTLTSVPANSWTVNNWYKQNIYDPSDNNIGDIKDVLVDRAGKITALIVGVGGFLGIGAKDVALTMQSFEIMPAKDGSEVKLKLPMTQEEIKQAANFEPYSGPRPQAMPGSRPAPASGTPSR